MGESTHRDWNLPDTRQLIQGAEKHEAEAHSSLFSDAYNAVVEHPVATAATAAAVGGLIWLTRGRGAAGAMEAGAAEMRAGVGVATREAEFKMGVAGRTTLEGAIIPQVERQQIQQGALSSGADAFSAAMTKAREGYASDVIKLYMENGAGRTAAELEKGAQDLVFKHVPPIGQFLKGTGRITEEQIEQALAIQKLQPQKKLGELLVENKLASQADVDLAFSRQSDMKAALKELHQKFKTTLPENMRPTE